MKDFNDFLKTLTTDEIKSIIDECQNPLAAIRDGSDKSNEAYFGNQVATTSLFISLGLLRRYHEWLAE